jgi:hypothetical protein
VTEIPEFDDETDISIRTTARIGSGFQMELEVVSESNEVRRTVLAQCDELLTCQLDGGSAAKIELAERHPLLWEYQHDGASAYFSGVPSNPLAAVGALIDAHGIAVKEWFGVSKYLNTSKSLRSLLEAGDGLLACGPVPLLEIYALTLREHGTEVQIMSPYPPGGLLSDPGRVKRLRTESKVLLIGKSYAVGLGWHFSELQIAAAVE